MEVYMKKLSVFSAWMMSVLLMLGLATGKAVAQAGDVVVHTTTVDITHFPGTEPVDQIDMTATFTNNELAEHRQCESTESLIRHGVKVTDQQGLCSASTRKSNTVQKHKCPRLFCDVPLEMRPARLRQRRT